MTVRRVAILSGMLCAIVEIAPPAWATVDNLKSFKAAYPGKDAKAYSCKICHQHVMGRKDDHNAYGAALKQSKAPGDAKKLVEKDFRALEGEDADGDGASNLQEIAAGTAPGDPASLPTGPAQP